MRIYAELGSQENHVTLFVLGIRLCEIWASTSLPKLLWKLRFFKVQAKVDPGYEMVGVGEYKRHLRLPSC